MANNSSSETASPVQLASNLLSVKGSPEIILCASLFYFRIPRAYWKERLEQIKFCGYNCIDVYFPWNYHEEEEGLWNFSGEKDAGHFLDLAAEAGLWVVARPGPYICSEWDGGALPSYLLNKEGIRLRDQEPVYLSYVAKWFDRILPILSSRQLGAAGTVLCVQLENELDFYGCRNPHGYLSSLRDMALAQGLTVPLIACAGQGGKEQATGNAEGIVPAFNFYPHDRDPAFEEKVLAYRAILAEQDLPLMVTETNRSHYLLRRLLSCGAKLLGPYLQASGTNFGFSNAANNWGNPLSFLTSDYDFGGMISPEGHLRKEAYEARLLSRMIRTYGRALAEAVPEDVAGCGSETGVARQALRLSGGGRLLFYTNLTDEMQVVDITAQADPAQDPKAPDFSGICTLPPGRSAALPEQVPLSRWNLQGTLVSSTAELEEIQHIDKTTYMVFAAEGSACIQIRLEQASEESQEAKGVLQIVRDGTLFTISSSGEGESKCRIPLHTGQAVELILIPRSKALLSDGIGPDGTIRMLTPHEYSSDPVQTGVKWSLQQIPLGIPITAAAPDPLAEAAALETLGVSKGYAWYQAATEVRTPGGRMGLLVERGSDAISVYAGDRYLGTLTPGGQTVYIPDPALHPMRQQWTLRVEQWGHTNFDDPRLPSLHLNAKKGIAGLTAVTRIHQLGANWRLFRSPPGMPDPALASPELDDRAWTMTGFGGWMTSEPRSLDYFRRQFLPSPEADSWILHLNGIETIVHVFIDGAEAGTVHPFDPTLNVSAYLQPGRESIITLCMERFLGLKAGSVQLYEGSKAEDWLFSASGESQLHEHAAAAFPHSHPASFPIGLAQGGTAWLYGKDLAVPDDGGKGWRVRVKGHGMKLTVFVHDRIVGRLWTEDSESRPVFAGGDPHSFYVPGCWVRQGEVQLSLLLEAVDTGRPASLEALEFIPV
ncbi:beta-galactosidase [Paenibacillus gansuensis]|uniref:Beta-galactosidase n=1 Tax=Paenibacillus gansuensis TaxID=306542 RepID=A0ABW5PDS3_9BACL